MQSPRIPPPPPVQDATTQLPALQATLACITPIHITPHAPQLITVLRARSQPFPAMPSQSPQPASHGVAHVPVVQLAAACGRPMQTAPHAPQSVVVRRLRSQPSVTLALQSPAPASQLAMRQLPATHAPLAAGGVHGASHAPQCSVLVVRSTQVTPHAVRLPLQAERHSTPPPAPVGPQTGVAPLHAVPHAPQFAVESSDVSQPSAGIPLQSPQPASHA